MLYEFHRVQNSKKPGSVYATYLLEGMPKNAVEINVKGHPENAEDVHMQSSPYMSSSMPQESNEEDAVTSRRIMLAREEELEGREAAFTSDTAYSIRISLRADRSRQRREQSMSKSSQSMSIA